MKLSEYTPNFLRLLPPKMQIEVTKSVSTHKNGKKTWGVPVPISLKKSSSLRRENTFSVIVISLGAVSIHLSLSSVVNVLKLLNTLTQ